MTGWCQDGMVPKYPLRRGWNLNVGKKVAANVSRSKLPSRHCGPKLDGLLKIDPESLKIVIDRRLEGTSCWKLNGRAIRPRVDG